MIRVIIIFMFSSLLSSQSLDDKTLSYLSGIEMKTSQDMYLIAQAINEIKTKQEILEDEHNYLINKTNKISDEIESLEQIQSYEQNLKEIQIKIKYLEKDQKIYRERLKKIELEYNNNNLELQKSILEYKKRVQDIENKTVALGKDLKLIDEKFEKKLILLQKKLEDKNKYELTQLENRFVKEAIELTQNMKNTKKINENNYKKIMSIIHHGIKNSKDLKNIVKALDNTLEQESVSRKLLEQIVHAKIIELNNIKRFGGSLRSKKSDDLLNSYNGSQGSSY